MMKVCADCGEPVTGRQARRYVCRPCQGRRARVIARAQRDQERKQPARSIRRILDADLDVINAAIRFST